MSDNRYVFAKEGIRYTLASVGASWVVEISAIYPERLMFTASYSSLTFAVSGSCFWMESVRLWTKFQRDQIFNMIKHMSEYHVHGFEFVGAPEQDNASLIICDSRRLGSDVVPRFAAPALDLLEEKIEHNRQMTAHAVDAAAAQHFSGASDLLDLVTL